MKTVILSFAAMALMMISSVATAQCSSCGQAAAQPITFAQPIATEAISYAQPEAISFAQPETVSYAQPATSGCSSCGTANVATYSAPVQASYTPQASSSCCAAVSYNAPVATNPCCCGTSSRGGLLRGNRGGLFGNTVPSRAARSGLLGAIRDN